ncbi:hypothetical protein FUAX_37980 [Fulvitalea axinellae]|uniref:Uncharacterized protein n=1 Tax=Fulvitalea axinellae TaxID=1182444 RepID=A0AAU9DDU5_9BACT|nr:hypothetical protein FUAX_37980 [Fulvitalea axinellae]
MVQRAVGFEVEVKNWRTWKPSLPHFYGECLLRHNDFYRDPHSAKDLLLEADDFNLTADRPTTESVPEFVTEPFPETPDGHKRLKKAFAKIQELVRLLHSQAQANPQMLVPGIKIENFGDLRSPSTIFDAVKTPDFHPQANAGVRLENIPELLRRSGTRPAVGPSAKRLTRIQSVNTIPARAEMDSMKSAPARANMALEKFGEDYPGLPENWIPSSALRGLVAYIINYLECPVINYLSYPKSYFPVMARTDFAGMYALLSASERSFFSASSGLHFLEIFKRVEFGVDSGGPLDFSLPVFAKGIRRGQQKAKVRDLDCLDRATWIREITQGVDLLTRRHYPGPEEQKEQLDTIGSWDNSMDQIGFDKSPAPILELRRLQFSEDIEELPRIAEDVFLMIWQLNRRNNLDL